MRQSQFDHLAATKQHDYASVTHVRWQKGLSF